MMSKFCVFVMLAGIAVLIRPTISSPSDKVTDVVYGKDKDRGDSVLVEGDLLLTPEQFHRLRRSQGKGSPERLSKRGFAATDLERRWANAVIPYVIEPELFSPTDQYNINRAMTEWEKYTCVKWRQKDSSDKYWVKIRGDGGCMSYLGFNGGVKGQSLYLGPACRKNLSRYLHEMGHTIGLVHEQRRTDRDSYVRVHKTLLETDFNYWKYNASEAARRKVGSLGTPFDFKSIMLYGAYDRVVNELPGITAVKPSDGQWIHFNLTDWGRALSFGDVKIVNIMYNCSDHCPNKNKCTGNGFLDQNCNCTCPDGTTNCDRTKRPERSTCANKFFDDWRCMIWANRGECERNSKWMNSECAKACGLCQQKDNRGSEATSRCKNVFSDQKCEDWKWRGNCVTNREWMRRNCPDTCGLCRGNRNRPDAKCANSHPVSTLCDDFALEGGCLLRPVAMHTNCQRSCFQCHLRLDEIDRSWSEVNDTIQEEQIPCIDRSPNCAILKATGRCNEGGTSYWCPKSCGKCEDGTCKNLESAHDCQFRESRLECIGNSVWMSRHCALSCGRRQCRGMAPTAAPTTARTTTTTTTTTETTDELCRNVNDPGCDAYAAQGKCETSRNYMQNYCPKSCNFCP